MHVHIDHTHSELVQDYRGAAEQLRRTRDDLYPLLRKASDLLNESFREEPAFEFGRIAVELLDDAHDLERRGDFLIEADARVAMLINEQAGDLVNQHLVDDAIRNGWTYAEADLRHQLAELRRLPFHQQLARAGDILQIGHTLQILAAPHSTLGVQGDTDSDLREVRIGAPLRVSGATPAERGHNLVVRALEDTANPDATLQDEFEVILHENGNLTIVLPGVIDLSDKLQLFPHFGWDEEHRSLRDLEMAAAKSSQSTRLEDNEYGLRVRDWVRMAVEDGVIEPRASTTIIGHSFGADTALDLAADPELNGLWLDVTHVVPMAYHNEPQFRALPENTQVLAIQNIWDMPVLAESIGATGMGLQGVGELHNTLGRYGVEGIEGLADAGGWLINETLNEIEGAVADEWGVEFDVPPIPKAEIMHDDYREISDNMLLVEFEGGLGGAGHEQSHYIGFLERTCLLYTSPSPRDA